MGRSLIIVWKKCHPHTLSMFFSASDDLRSFFGTAKDGTWRLIKICIKDGRNLFLLTVYVSFDFLAPFFILISRHVQLMYVHMCMYWHSTNIHIHIHIPFKYVMVHRNILTLICSSFFLLTCMIMCTSTWPFKLDSWENYCWTNIQVNYFHVVFFEHTV